MNLMKKDLFSDIVQNRPRYIIISLLLLLPLFALEIYMILINFTNIKEFIGTVVGKLPETFTVYMIGYFLLILVPFISFVIISEILIEPIYFHIYYRKRNNINIFKIICLRVSHRLMNVVGIALGYVLAKFLLNNQLTDMVVKNRMFYPLFLLGTLGCMKFLTDNLFEYVTKNIQRLKF